MSTSKGTSQILSRVPRTTLGLVVTLFAWGCTVYGCNRHRPLDEKSSSSATAATSVAPAPSSSEPPAGSADTRPELKWYGWVGDSSYPVPETTHTMWDRFTHSSLRGFTQFAAEPESWCEWLRLLPLAAPGTPVKNYRGEIVVPGDDEHLAAVVAIDIGNRDIQQSADVILRLFAEWRWFVGDLLMLYLSDTKLELPLEKWRAGERLVFAGKQQKWVAQEPPQSKLDHAAFRAYLDSVFSSSDFRALIAESVAITPESLAPGAFFLHEGHPSEVVVVLDVATSRSGERAMILMRARNPAESIHVLRPSRDSVWFPVRTDQPLQIPRTRPFSWKELRRMKPLRSPPAVACVGSLCPKTAASSNKHSG